MKTLDWIEKETIATGLLCEEFTNKVHSAGSKKQLFEIWCSVNGASWLQEMHDKGVSVPYEIIEEDWGRYINGKHKPEFKREGAKYGYTSCIYFRYAENDSLEMDTTVASFFDCKIDLFIPKNRVAQIFVDVKSKIRIHCHPTARIVVDYWGSDDTIEIIEGKDRVRLKKKANGQ